MSEDDDAPAIDSWVRVWDERRAHAAGGLTGDDEGDRRPRRYVVSMFPYPSGDLHMGHAEVYAIGDAIARFARLRGDNVLHPIGWDSFGLPAENAAFKRGLDPREWTYANIAVQAEGFRRLGVSVDWRTRLHTSDPGYYRWNQWLFLRLYERGLAYRRDAPVNWCPTDRTVLANEQVIAGQCERCGTVVVRRNLTQWFFRITAYVQRLLDDMADLQSGWPADVLTMQRHWIGKASGAHIDFPIEGVDEPVRVFSTRPDTLYGATFLVVAADAPMATRLCMPEHRAELADYQDRTQAASEIDRLATGRTGGGVFLGRYGIHPLTGQRLPVYAADYVLPDHGTGAIMAVPAHDPRDLDFAHALGLPVSTVVDTGQPDPAHTGIAATGDGVLVNSGPYTGMATADAATAITTELARWGRGGPQVSYRLRDWLVSRQRYWGTPIPIIHCPRCGQVPVPDNELPVTLPASGYQLRPTDGRSPLATAIDWVTVACPSCGGPAQRDTDTMDTFVDSSWYFLRYPDPTHTDGPFHPDGIARWLPVDEYIGGKEHATSHLLYARFITKVLHDLGLLPFTEPFRRLTNQGQVIMNGKAMSKTLGNLVDLHQQLAEYGPDAVRVTMLFAGPPEDDIDWADVSPAAAVKWLARIQRLATDLTPADPGQQPQTGDVGVRRRVHQLINQTTELMHRTRLNVAIARLMELTTLLRKAVDTGPGPTDPAVREGVQALTRMLSCFAPYTAEQAWEQLGHPPSVSEHGWPTIDEHLVTQDTVTCVVQVDGNDATGCRCRQPSPTRN